MGDVRHPTSVVLLRVLRSRGEGLARISPPPQGLREEWLIGKEVKGWTLLVRIDDVDVVVVVAAVDAVNALMTAGDAGAVTGVAVAVTAVAAAR